MIDIQQKSSGAEKREESESNEQQLVIAVGGDIVPIGGGLPLFESGAAGQLVGADLLDIIGGCDFSVFNLEVPLADTESPIEKCGPNLIAPTASIAGLTAINPGAFALANNHVMDQCAQGLRSTIATLEASSAPWFGAGTDLAEASRPYVLEKDGVKIGFYACAEHEFSIAGESSPGANPFDPLESPDHVAALKAECDRVVVLYHGGKEHYRYPSPQLRKVCRKLAEKGADLVVCQHSHCIGCREEWAGAELVYGQGNFLFDHSDSEFWQTGLLLRLSVSCEEMRIEHLPLRKQGAGVRLAEGDDARNILAGFEERSWQIQQKGFVEAEYGRFASGMLPRYLRAFIPHSFMLPFRALNKLSKGRLQKGLASKQGSMAQINYLECEAHRELFLEGLKGL